MVRLKKLVVALAIFAALAAVVASSALAAAVTEDVKWYVGAAPGTELAGSETIAASQSGEATFTAHVSGQLVGLHWTGTECLECTIENTATEGAVISSGKLRFTGVKAAKPAGCAVSSGTNTTNPVGGNPGWMSGSTDYIRIKVLLPGEAEEFFGFHLTGGSCPLEGSYNVRGNTFFHVFVTTGTQAVERSWNTSESINKEAGGSLRVGTEPAALTLSGEFKLAGAKAGSAWGTH